MKKSGASKDAKYAVHSVNFLLSKTISIRDEMDNVRPLLSEETFDKFDIIYRSLNNDILGLHNAGRYGTGYNKKIRNEVSGRLGNYYMLNLGYFQTSHSRGS